MNGWSLRLARAEDAEQLPAIETDAGRLFAGDAVLADMMSEDDRISEDEHRGYIARGRCLVAEVDGRIAGFLTAETAGRAIHIVELSVGTANQRKGIGAGLVRAAMIDAGNSGYSSLTLTTFHDIAWNAPFYKRLGFVKVEDLAAQPRLAHILEKELEAGMPVGRRIAMIRFID